MKNKLYNLFISIGEYALYALMFSLAISTSAVEISALFMLICFIGRRIIKPDFGFLMFWPNIFLISFLLFNAISIFNSGPYLNISLNSLFRKWMQYALIFIIVQNSIYDQKIIKRCAFAFLFGASLAIFSGLSQYFFGVEFLRNRHLINASGMAPAMTSSFAHYNGFGGYIVTVLSLLVALLMA
ncbi:MAG: hypothetical protein NT033_01475, partial [Candidatus Omnitrophica bacterium]|nr:hypothetical protein [Candidatus Omnitrophota bacterium]